MFLIVPILPVQLIAFDLICGRGLDSVVIESDQVELRRVALVGRLRLSLRLRVLLLVLRLLLGWRAALHLTLLLLRVTLLIPIILLGRGR